MIAAFTAGSYAELVSKYPQAGGAALYVHRAFKSAAADVHRRLRGDVLRDHLGQPRSRAAFGGDYLSEFVDCPGGARRRSRLLAVVALINFRGITESVKLNVGCTMIEIGGLLLVVADRRRVARSTATATRARAFEFKEGAARRRC